MKRKLLVLIILVICAVFVLVGLSSISHKTAAQYGNANIIFQLPDTQGMSATINGDRLGITGLQATYKLNTGTKNLTVQKPGYKPYSVSFQVASGQTVIINVIMQSTAPQAPAAATNQVSASFVGFIPKGFSVVQTVYFYSNTWVVATVNADGGDNAIMVAKYVGGTNPWQTVLGPGTLFSTNDTANLPPQVSSYMIQQDYILGGD